MAESDAKKRSRIAGYDAEGNPTLANRGAELVGALKRGAEKTQADREAYRSGQYDPADTIALERAGRVGRETIDPAAAKAKAAKDAAQASLEARGMAPRGSGMTAGQQVASAEGAFADSREALARASLGMQGAQTVSSVANPDYGVTKQYVDTSRDITNRSMDAQVAIDQAEMARAAKVADFMGEQADKQAAAITDMQARHFVQEEEAIEAQERTRKAYGLVSQTTERLMQGSDRWWASRTDGQKAGAFLGMLGRGAGGGNPSDFLNERIDRELESLKAASAAAQSQGDLARGMYADIRTKTADEREADAIYAAARAEQMKAQFEDIAAKSALPSIMAQQQQSRLVLEQMVADRRLQLGKIANHNVKRKTVVSKAYRTMQDPQTGQVYRVPIGGPGDVALAKHDLEEASKSRGDARKLLGEEVTEGIKAGVKSEQENLEREKFTYMKKKDQAGGEKGAAVETALGLGRDYLAMYGENVPGRTEGGLGGDAWLNEPSWWRSDEGLRESKQREAMSMWYATALTGANVSKTQEEFLEKLATDPNMSGNEIRAGIRDLNRSLEIYQSTYQRSADEETQAEYRGVDPAQLPRRDPKTGGMTRSNTGAEEQAGALGGKLR